MVYSVTCTEQFATESGASDMSLCFADSIDNVYHTLLCENGGTAIISNCLFISEIIRSFEARDTMIGITKASKEEGSSQRVTRFFFFLKCSISYTSEV